MLTNKEWVDLVIEVIENFDLDFDLVGLEMISDESLKELLEDVDLDFGELNRVTMTDSVTIRFEFDSYGFYHIFLK